MKLVISIVFTAIILPYIGMAQIASTNNNFTVYESDDLVITRLTGNVYVHTSFLYSATFGKVSCNGMVVVSNKEAIVFDTPSNDTSSAELINWIRSKLRSTIRAVIPTHFHEDCLGGLGEFHRNNIPSYANEKTIELAKYRHFNVPINSFNDSLVLSVGGTKVYARFLGEGHTKDNIVGYFPDSRILFGGCLIKALGAGKGNLEDANVTDWADTVEKVKKAYPEVAMVIPGHGAFGDKALLDYTIRLFKSGTQE